MKNAIWKKILFFVVIPFLIIFGILSLIIVRSVVIDKNKQIEADIRNLVRFNEANFLGLIDSVRLSVTTASSELGKLREFAPDARKQGENILLSMFENKYVYNARLTYEPMAFDGLDDEFTRDYPGAPSGRFMRSYIRKNNGYIMAPDMDETTIDDPKNSIWYTAPRDLARPYLGLIDTPAYDYGTGEGNLNVSSISAPIFRDGVVIGCVGADILFQKVFLGSEIFPEAVTAVFSREHKIIYANDIGNVGKKIEDLDFTDPEIIKKAFDDETELFIAREHSYFLGDRSFTYFKPVFIEGFDDTLYFYAAVPGNVVTISKLRLLSPIVASLLAALLMFGILLHYIWRSVLKPIHDLTVAADAISRGDLDMEIAVTESNDEIGVMTHSLHHMVEQFRVNITLMKRAGDLLDLHTRLNEAVYHHDDIKGAFDSMVYEICTYFNVHKTSLVFLVAGRAKILSCYEPYVGFRSESGESARDFLFHDEIKASLGAKNILFLDKHAIAEQKIDFTDWETTSVCILPIKIEGNLRGYFILERKQWTSAFAHDDTCLAFISDTVSYILTQKETYSGSIVSPQEEAGEPSKKYGGGGPAPKVETEPPDGKTGDMQAVSGARDIAGLDVDRGIRLIGDSQEQYVKLLQVSAKVFGDAVGKMRNFLAGDIRSFAIEVHGTKGALFNIGANDLGELAQELETSAKTDDLKFCRERYPVFEAKLISLKESLDWVVNKDVGPRETGNLELLAGELVKARLCCENYDSFSALDIINPLARLEYEGPKGEETGKTLWKIVDLLEALEYENACVIIDELSEILMESGQ
jgi:HAMP domain-containing protein/HPt (histidine-containing phosphotransfer) domain-containing protein